jgi:hypothetical protein
MPLLLYISMGPFTKREAYEGNANQHHTKIPPHPFRVAIIRNTTNNRCSQRCGEKGTLVHCWWKCKLVQPLWKKKLEAS